MAITDGETTLHPADGIVTLNFTFTVNEMVADDVDMLGGLVEMRIPTGWIFDNNDNADGPPVAMLTSTGTEY